MRPDTTNIWLRWKGCAFDRPRGLGEMFRSPGVLLNDRELAKTLQAETLVGFLYLPKRSLRLYNNVPCIKPTFYIDIKKMLLRLTTAFE